MAADLPEPASDAPPGRRQSPASRLRQLASRAALMLAALTALAWHARPDGRLHLLFPALPGDAVIVRVPDGDFVLIDGGADPAALAAALGRALPFWQRHLAGVVLTSPDPQRLPGQVALLGRYHARLALAPPRDSRGATYAEWRRLLAEQRAPIRVARPGARLTLGGVAITVLHAGEEGVALRISYGRTCALLAHALEPAAESELAQAAGPCDLLVYPWERDPRGPLVDAVRPRHIVFTDGYRGEAAVELTYAERAVGGAGLYHERNDGTVEWVSDGRRSWVASW